MLEAPSPPHPQPFNGLASFCLYPTLARSMQQTASRLREGTLAKTPILSEILRINAPQDSVRNTHKVSLDKSHLISPRKDLLLATTGEVY